MRRIATILACTVFVLMLAVPALAAGQLQFTVTPSVTQAAPGDEVEFEVSVKGDAYTSIGYIPTYDKNVWEFVTGECLMDYTGLGAFSRSDGGIMSFTDAAVRDGAVFRFTMEVKADAPAGKTTLAGTVAAKDGGAALDTALTDVVVTIRSGSTVEPTQTEATKPVEQTSPTQSMEETVATQQTQPVPPDSPGPSTQSTAPSQATDPTQAIATEGNQPTQETAEDSSLTIGEGTVPELEDTEADWDGEDDTAQEADSVPKGNDTLLVWLAVISVVAAATAAAWFFLRKKEIE